MHYSTISENNQEWNRSHKTYKIVREVKPLSFNTFFRPRKSISQNNPNIKKIQSGRFAKY